MECISIFSQRERFSRAAATEFSVLLLHDIECYLYTNIVFGKAVLCPVAAKCGTAAHVQFCSVDVDMDLCGLTEEYFIRMWQSCFIRLICGVACMDGASTGQNLCERFYCHLCDK